jgi:hypothetical protein
MSSCLGFRRFIVSADLDDLNETINRLVTAGGDEFDTSREFLEVILLRGMHRMLSEERNHRLQQIRPLPHDESMQMLPGGRHTACLGSPDRRRRTHEARADIGRSMRLASPRTREQLGNRVCSRLFPDGRTVG